MAKSDVKISVTTEDKASKGLKDIGDAADGLSTKGGKIGPAMAAGGAAIVAVGAAALASVDHFADAAIEVGKFADATGTTAEDASRLAEAFGDIGVESGTLETAIGKMAKQLGANEQAFAKYGVEVAKNADGTTNVTETFLRAIDAINAIEDPLQRETAASQMFGKNWKEMAEGIKLGSSGIRTAMSEVSDAQVFSEGDVQSGRDFRAALDEIKDAGEGLVLTIGRTLAPTISKLAPKIGEVIEKAAPLAEAVGDGLVDAFDALGPAIDTIIDLAGPLVEGLVAVVGAVGDITSATLGGVEQSAEYKKALAAQQEALEAVKQSLLETATESAIVKEATKTLADAADDAADRQEYYESRVEGVKEELEKAEEATRNLQDAYKELTDELDDEESWLDAQDAVDDYRAKIADADASLRDKQHALIDVKQSLIEYLSSLEGVPPEKQTEILALIEQGKIDEAEKALANLTRARNVPINPVTGGAMVVVPRFDSGGIVPGPRGQPTLIVAEGGETVLPTHKGPAEVRGQAGVTINFGGVVLNNTTDVDGFARVMSMQLAVRT